VPLRTQYFCYTHINTLILIKHCYIGVCLACCLSFVSHNIAEFAKIAWRAKFPDAPGSRPVSDLLDVTVSVLEPVARRSVKS
jgi:hypothetical protein